MTAASRTILIITQAVVSTLAGFIVACVTGRAGGCIAGRRPGDDLGIGSVTPGAGKVAAVIQWLVRQAGVTVIGRHPRDCRMAQTALLSSVKVIRILTRCRRAVVARGTRTQYLRVIDSNDGRPHGRAVAVLADVRGLRVLRTLARRIGAVVAARAVAGDIRVVEIRRPPRDRRVTVIAVVAARDVRRVLARSRDTIMAGAAGTEDLGVVDSQYWRPHSGRVAVLADVRCRHVLEILARCVIAVMAANAVARDIRVIDGRGQPARCRVTVVAAIGSRYVRRVLAGG